MARRASPGIGDNGSLPEPAAVLHGLALETLFQERKKTLREAHKRARKSIEANGVPLADLDTLYKMQDETVGEIELWFRRKFAVLGAFFTQIPAQLDLFTPKPVNPEAKAAIKHAGRLVGLRGEPATPPAGMEGAEMNEWLGGHAEAADARAKAEPDLAKFLSGALVIAEAGEVVDGTKTGPDGKALAAAPKGRSGIAAKVRAQAAADFKADNGGLTAAEPQEPGAPTLEETAVA